MCLNALVSLLLLIGPLLIGINWGLSLALWARLQSSGMRIMCASAGVLWGFFAASLLLRTLDFLGIRANGEQFLAHTLSLVIATILVASCFASLKLHSAKQADLPRMEQRKEPRPKSGVSNARWTIGLPILFCAASALALCAVYQGLLLPLSSWDGLGMWGQWSHWFLSFHLTEDGANGITKVGDASFPFTHPRHPPTLIHLSAYTSFAFSLSEITRGWWAPWTVIWISGASLVWGLVREFASSQLAAWLAVYIYASAPLLENHAQLTGYAELWTSICVLQATALLTASLLHRSVRLQIIGLAVALLPLLLKNSGVLIVLTCLASYTFVAGLEKYKTLTFCVVGAILVVFISAYYWGFNIKVFDYQIALQRENDAAIIFGGYEMNFKLNSFSKVIKNQSSSLLVKQSFSTSLLIWLITLLLYLKKQSNLANKEGSAQLYLLLMPLCYLMVFTAPHLVTAYSDRFAAPESDLGNSRFLLGFSPLTSLTIAVIFSVLSPSDSKKCLD